MRNNRLSKLLRIALALVISVFFLSACGGSSSDKGEEKESEPTTRIKNQTDVEAELVGFDSNGITFNIACESDRENVLFMPMWFEAEGKSFYIFDSEGNHNPDVTIKANDEDVESYIDCKVGETYKVFISLNGITDYSNLKIRVDESVYTDNSHYPIKDVILEFTTK